MNYIKKTYKDEVKRRKIRSHIIKSDSFDPYFIMRKHVSLQKNASLIADKIYSKNFIKNKNIVSSAPIVWVSGEKLELEKLTDEFYWLKSNTGSGYNKKICSTYITEKLLKKYEKKWKKSLKFGLDNGQTHYNNVKYKIFLEKCIGHQSNDFKIHLYNDNSYEVMVSRDRGLNTFSQTTYNSNYEIIPNLLEKNSSSINLAEKEIVKEMVKISILIRKMFQINKYARYDFYIKNKEIYFGEITLIHYGGSIILDKQEHSPAFIKRANEYIKKIKL